MCEREKSENSRPRNLFDWDEKPACETGYSREDGRETECDGGEGKNEPNKKSRPRLVESEIDHYDLPEHLQIPPAILHKLRGENGERKEVEREREDEEEEEREEEVEEEEGEGRGGIIKFGYTHPCCHKTVAFYCFVSIHRNTYVHTLIHAIKSYTHTRIPPYPHTPIPSHNHTLTHP